MPVIIATDIVVFLISAFVVYFAFNIKREGAFNTIWTTIRESKFTTIAAIFLMVYLSIALMDSLRWRDAIDVSGGSTAASETIYSPQALSILDRVFFDLKENKEKTFSSPLSEKQFTKELIEHADGSSKRDYPDLKYPGSHLLGTDKVGNDVLYLSLKGVRTGVVIGTGTTLIIIPFALFFGILAGYKGGLTDDIIQYIYTTLSSIPDILLITAFMLIFGTAGYQGGLIQDKHLIMNYFILNDRLFWLILIMGITSWTGLCRIIRGETLKLREMYYVRAAKSFGLSTFKILYRHIAPNLMHLVIITFVLQFSGLVFAEAILSYIGIGVGPEMGSWGNMINTARLELSREPVVWWSLVGAFIFMFFLVLPANILSDALRDALDPKLKSKRD